MAKKKKSKSKANKETVFAVIDDLVANLMIRDREGDEDLPRGEIEKMLLAETLSVDDLVERFQEALEEHMEDVEAEEGGGDEDDDEDDEGPLELDDEDD